VKALSSSPSIKKKKKEFSVFKSQKIDFNSTLGVFFYLLSPRFWFACSNLLSIMLLLRTHFERGEMSV
jgi:hypothetical protein